MRSLPLLATVLPSTPFGGERVLFLRAAWVFAFAASFFFFLRTSTFSGGCSHQAAVRLVQLRLQVGLPSVSLCLLPRVRAATDSSFFPWDINRAVPRAPVVDATPEMYCALFCLCPARSLDCWLRRAWPGLAFQAETGRRKSRLFLWLRPPPEFSLAAGVLER